MNAGPTALLARARELARASLPPAVAGALAVLPKELRAAVADATLRPEQTLLGDAAVAAEAHRGAIAATFETSVLEIFDRKLRPVAPAAAGPLDLEHLTLVDDAAMELEIALGRLVRKTVDEIDAEQLAGVGARLGELAAGKPLEGHANPLGPETALEALKRAAETVPQSGPVRMALVNALQPHVALALRKLYVELNDLLLAAGVLPKLRRQVQRPAQGPGAARATSAGAPTPAAAGAPKLPGMPAGMTLSQAMSLKDLMPGATGSPIDVRAIVGALLEGPATSRRYGARMLANPEGSLYARAMMTPVPESVIAQLSRLQGAAIADTGGGPGDLAAVVAHLARAREHPLEQLTGELVAVVFDFVLHDRDLPEAVKTELARLQIASFKAALLDRTFFAKREHPLRALLTAIADAAADPDLDAAPDGRFVAGLRAIVDEVLGAFAEDLAVFVAARERLAGLVAGLRAEGVDEIAALAAELEGRERDEASRARAAAAVAKRIAAAPPAFVQRFLADTWTHVLAEAERHGRDGDDGWDARLGLVDDLVWSVGPKQAADVARLTALLPKLVSALNRGMKALDVPAAAQAGFLDELMRAHAALIQAARSQRSPAPAAGPAPPPAAAPAPLPPDTIAAPELAADPHPVLERGAVVEFRDADPPVRAKLTWVSPQQTIYLFTARGAAARQISRADLAAALRDGRAYRSVDAGAVIDRALAAVVGGA